MGAGATAVQEILVARTEARPWPLWRCVVSAFIVGAGFQAVVVGGAGLRTPGDFSSFTSGLLVTHQHDLGQFAAIAARNLIPLLAFSLAGLTLGRAEHREARAPVRLWLFRLFLFGVPNVMCAWPLTYEMSTLARMLFLSPAAVALRLPHSFLEFTAFELPIVAALAPAGERAGRLRRVGWSIPAALALLVVGALVETYVSPRLITIR